MATKEVVFVVFQLNWNNNGHPNWIPVKAFIDKDDAKEYGRNGKECIGCFCTMSEVELESRGYREREEVLKEAGF